MKKPITLDYQKTSCVEHEQVEHLLASLHDELAHIEQARQQHYNSSYAFMWVPFDDASITQLQKLVAEKKKKNLRALLVIGIGGSNLGTIAVHEALHGEFYNEQIDNIKVYFADTVDSDYIASICSFVEQLLQQGQEVLLNVISKSGTTTEMVANFELLYAIVQKYQPQNFADSIVITTDKDSPLWHYGKKLGCSLLEIPKHVGGRYSVFTAVGLFPLAMLGVDMQQLLQGAQQAVHDGLLPQQENIAAVRAILLYALYDQGIAMHDLFVFSKQLAGYNYWYRQLLAESIGKEFDLANKRVEVGITPTVSIGTTDLHSVAQLYLATIIDRFTTFVTVAKPKHALQIPMMPEAEALAPAIQGLELSELMSMISQGVERAYQAKQRPFCVVSLQTIDAFTLGYLLQTHMIEIVLLGHLLNINPFDQPNVELYKKEVQRLLAER